MSASAPIFGVCRLRMGTDGSGITTLVTFMGCPLMCKYCINDDCHKPIYKQDGTTINEGIMIVTPKQLYDIVKIDNIYFTATNGGICFGGGEPGLYSDFISEFKSLCPERWNIYIETSLFYDAKHIEKLAKLIDHWFVDIKDMNSTIYLSYTNKHNARVKSNLIRLKELVGVEIVTIRVPLIMDYNTPKDQEYSISELNSLGFNDIETFKYVKPKKQRQ